MEPRQFLLDNTEYINYQYLIKNSSDIKKKISLVNELRHKDLNIKGLPTQIVSISELLNDDEILRKIYKEIKN